MKAVEAIRQGGKYLDVADQFQIGVGTLYNWFTKKVTKKGAGAKSKLPFKMEEKFADFLEEAWLNLTPKCKKDFIEEVNYYIATSTSHSIRRDLTVDYGWLYGLQVRFEKADFATVLEAKSYSSKNCSNVQDWTKIRHRLLQHVNEPELPSKLEQIFMMDIIRLQSSGHSPKSFDVLTLSVASGKILRMYVHDQDGSAQPEFKKEFGVLMKFNGELTGSCLAVVIHDIER